MFEFIVSLLAILSLVSAASINCKYTETNGLTIDLTPLMKDNGDYRVFDYLEKNTNQSFVFNICRDVVSIPKDGTGGNNCAVTIHDINDDGTKVPEKRHTPSFIVNDVTDECHRASSPLEDKDNSGFSYYDYQDKAKGVVLSYWGGDYIWAGYSYHSTSLWLRCANVVSFPKSAEVFNSWYGEHRIMLESIYACPSECFPDDKGLLCSGHGVCMNDASLELTRCFCNSKFKGDKCQKGIGLAMSDYFMIVDIAAVIIVLCTIIYFGCKLRKIRLDPEADVSLDTKFNELGSIAYTI